MRISVLAVVASLSQSIAIPACAADSLDQPLSEGLENIGETNLFLVDFPNCVMDFFSASDIMQNDGLLLRATDNVDLANGVFRGTWALRLPEGHDNEGNYLVEVKCGSGLGQITALPN